MKQKHELPYEAGSDWRCVEEPAEFHRNSPLGEEVEQDMVFELSVEDVLVIHAWTRSKHILNNGPETHTSRQTDMRNDQDGPEGTRHSEFRQVVRIRQF